MAVLGKTAISCISYNKEDSTVLDKSFWGYDGHIRQKFCSGPFTYWCRRLPALCRIQRRKSSGAYPGCGVSSLVPWPHVVTDPVELEVSLVGKEVVWSLQQVPMGEFQNRPLGVKSKAMLSKAEAADTPKVTISDPPWVMLLYNPVSVGRTCNLLVANRIWQSCPWWGYALWQRWWDIYPVDYVTLYKTLS